MALNDKRLFAFLKESKVFTEDGRGKYSLQEALIKREQRTNYNDRARHLRRKSKVNK
jgi:hypothetical protein